MTRSPSKVLICSSAGEITFLPRNLLERIPLKRGESLCLMPFKSLSIQPFSYPFTNLSQIREALAIKVRPYRIEGKGVEIFPAVFDKDGRSSRGVAWFISSEELEKTEANLTDISGNILNWPLPMAFASKVNGTGSVIWTDGESICSMLFRGYYPVLYRWNVYSENCTEREKQWLYSYSRSSGDEIEEAVVIDSRKTEEYENLVSTSLLETLKAFPRYSQINVSKKVMDSFLMTERMTGLLSRILSVILVSGILFASGSFIRYSSSERHLETLQTRSIEVFRDVFHARDRIIDPLSQAKSIIAEIAGTEKGLSLEELMARIGMAWSEVEQSGIVLNSIRYSGDYMDMSGTASEMVSVQVLQKSLDTKEIKSSIGDMQQIPGGGIRFNMTIRW